MNFASAKFACFYVTVVCLYWAIRHRRARKVMLLGASYFFYMSWNVKLVSLILASTVLDYAMGQIMARSTSEKRRKVALIASCIGNLGLLCVFKYANFFVHSFQDLLGLFGLHATEVELNIILPVGISFYTFQTLSYTIDLYRRKMPPCNDALDFALFVAFFPQLVAGPIVRAKSFLPQLKLDHRWNTSRFASGLYQMLIGLAKKVVIADTLAIAADQIFGAPGAYGLIGSWIGVLAFTFQIYADFSGYSDVAIGASRILGYELPQNFDHPYLSRTPREFWLRWHISLSSWLRDYLYIPLGGNRGSRLATQRNLMTTMLLGGLWHGASWTFVAWGLYHGLLLVLGRVYGALFPTRDETNHRPGLPFQLLQTLMMFVLASCGWVFFRAQTFADAATVFGGMIGLRGLDSTGMLRVSSVWVMLLVVVTHALAGYRERTGKDLSASLFARTIIVTGCIIGIITFAREAPNAFIYFQF